MDQGVARSTVENVFKKLPLESQLRIGAPDPEEKFVGIGDLWQTAEPVVNLT